jgi:GrpB-like predicted nucleotidyltransferase (UPF0157 family)
MPTFEEITRHHEPDPDGDPWVHGPPPPTVVEVVPYDEDWPARFDAFAAKNVIDIVLTVADPADEGGYVPHLERIGYVLNIREPSFHQHRCLVWADPRVNLHVFGPDCPETIRLRMFRAAGVK